MVAAKMVRPLFINITFLVKLKLLLITAYQFRRSVHLMCHAILYHLIILLLIQNIFSIYIYD